LLKASVSTKRPEPPISPDSLLEGAGFELLVPDRKNASPGKWAPSRGRQKDFEVVAIQRGTEGSNPPSDAALADSLAAEGRVEIRKLR
jgi:hypothetical protein